jgi:glycosyltransferase involved in cell wall biosynthesis
VKIAIDAAALARDRRGMGRLARGIVRALERDAAWDVTLLVAAARDADSLQAEFPATRVAHPRTSGERNRYDVVWYPFNGMRFVAAARSVVSIADAFAFSQAHPQWVARKREQRPIRRAARHATKIVTISAWSRREIGRELGVAERDIAVIAPTPDPYFFPARDSVPPSLGEGRFVLVVGAREARKNVRLALEACARALSGAAETLVIVGELPPPERARALRLNLRCGEIRASDGVLRALYRRASVVLVPSYAEGFGLVAVEALACGSAVIAADAAALPEATQGAALLRDPDDVAAWSEAIRSLLDDEELRLQWSARAVARFGASDRSRYANEMSALLREVGGEAVRSLKAAIDRS